MNFSGYVGHVTVFSGMLTFACCLVVGLGLGLELASGWLVVIHNICTTFHCHCHTAIKVKETYEQRHSSLGANVRSDVPASFY